MTIDQIIAEFPKYFSANALDGEDIDHKGTMIAPRLAVDIAESFLRTKLEALLGEAVQEIRQGLVPIEEIAKHDNQYDATFDIGGNAGMRRAVAIIEAKLK